MSIPQAVNNDQQSGSGSEERRNGPADRRSGDKDRRNAERIAQDLVPRRDPERKDRRKS